MTKVAILPLSLYLNNNQSRTEQAFVKLGVSRASLLWQFIPLPSFMERFRQPAIPKLITQYRKGELTTAAFHQAIQAKFPRVRLTQRAFKSAWNAMQQVSELTLDAINEAQTLNQQGIEIYWTAGTNPLHMNALRQQHGVLPGHTYFSYEHQKLETELLEKMINDIRQKHPRIQAKDIVMFYTAPQNPHPRMGALAWLFDPIKKFQYQQAQSYISRLQRKATELGFTLMPNPSTKQKSGLINKFQDMKWIKKAKTSTNTALAHHAELKWQLRDRNKKTSTTPKENVPPVKKQLKHK
jgi:hypothetical protein